MVLKEYILLNPHVRGITKMDYEFGRCPYCGRELMPIPVDVLEYVEDNGIVYKIKRNKIVVYSSICEMWLLRNIC